MLGRCEDRNAVGVASPPLKALLYISVILAFVLALHWLVPLEDLQSP